MTNAIGRSNWWSNYHWLSQSKSITRTKPFHVRRLQWSNLVWTCLSKMQHALHITHNIWASQSEVEVSKSSTPQLEEDWQKHRRQSKLSALRLSGHLRRCLRRRKVWTQNLYLSCKLRAQNSKGRSRSGQSYASSTQKSYTRRWQLCVRQLYSICPCVSWNSFSRVLSISTCLISTIIISFPSSSLITLPREISERGAAK